MITQEAVQKVLTDEIRPMLMRDGGNIELLRVEDNTVYVRLQGACAHCQGAVMTLKFGVEKILKEKFPELKEVVNE
ncbi:MAG: hypothetical protein A2096_07085 [Spirochaetes bacterium GWF1_41_5]|nr:MAG: hypothetical protein A2096_07085 [Spirochaetes bacterium GWF1_41_5]HBE02859.1 hypothetical protein [Spirochaetia bacterium]